MSSFFRAEQTQPSVPMRTLSNSETANQQPSADGVNTASALSAMQNPDISAAINRAIIDVLCQFSARQITADIIPSDPRSHTSQRSTGMRPIAKNNLFIITVLWTFLGLFILYGAANAKHNPDVEIVIFTIYGTVQVTLAVFTIIVTSTQARDLRSNNITLSFLLQGWMALVFCFAGTYLFFQNAYSLGVVKLPSIEQAVRRL
jgi:hypothetical protein